MKKTRKINKLPLYIVVVLFLGLISAAIWYFHHTNIAVLNPKGPIALQEYHLIILALALSLIVVIPVFTLTIVFAWKYRESNTKSKYSPELDGNKLAETIWWLIPTALITVLAVITWTSSHQLDPYKPIYSSTNSTMNIQVIALNWKWLFIYPKENIASINYFKIPINTPVNFEITSDAPMNSFWIPQLGGQIYAMPGMSTQLNLLASSEGNYYGSSANISGSGFAGMNFTANATSQTNFNSWVNNVRQNQNPLDLAEYNKLVRPSQNNLPSFYSTAIPGLYNTVVYRYSLPASGGGSNDSPQTQSLNQIQANQAEGMQGMVMQ